MRGEGIQRHSESKRRATPEPEDDSSSGNRLQLVSLLGLFYSAATRTYWILRRASPQTSSSRKSPSSELPLRYKHAHLSHCPSDFLSLVQDARLMSQTNQVKTDLERKLHTRLNQAWLDACLAFLTQSLSSGLPPLTQLSKLVEDQLILSSLDQSTLGCLPPNLSTSHGQIIKGEYLVQVQDCINVSEPRDRRFLHSAHRTLKLGLYDGIQSVSAMELTHIPQLSIDFPAGFKVRLWPPSSCSC
jgi:hypothetical protein